MRPIKRFTVCFLLSRTKLLLTILLYMCVLKDVFAHCACMIYRGQHQYVHKLENLPDIIVNVRRGLGTSVCVCVCVNVLSKWDYFTVSKFKWISVNVWTNLSEQIENVCLTCLRAWTVHKCWLYITSYDGKTIWFDTHTHKPSRRVNNNRFRVNSRIKNQFGESFRGHKTIEKGTCVNLRSLSASEKDL